uniref:Uncharacterized protein n=1 Tax=Oryza rufipogon TaxID=4529 RepID=A0A0E0RJ33_ORYRU
MFFFSVLGCSCCLFRTNPNPPKSHSPNASSPLIPLRRRRRVASSSPARRAGGSIVSLPPLPVAVPPPVASRRPLAVVPARRRAGGEAGLDAAEATPSFHLGFESNSKREKNLGGLS